MQFISIRQLSTDAATLQRGTCGQCTVVCPLLLLLLLLLLPPLLLAPLCVGNLTPKLIIIN